jgi:hypothetical protein
LRADFRPDDRRQPDPVEVSSASRRLALANVSASSCSWDRARGLDRSWPRAILGWPASQIAFRQIEETVAALGCSTELAHHLFRECWAVGTGSDTDLCRAFGWEKQAAQFLVQLIATKQILDNLRVMPWE